MNWISAIDSSSEPGCGPAVWCWVIRMGVWGVSVSRGGRAPQSDRGTTGGRGRDSSGGAADRRAGFATGAPAESKAARAKSSTMWLLRARDVSARTRTVPGMEEEKTALAQKRPFGKRLMLAGIQADQVPPAILLETKKRMLGSGSTPCRRTVSKESARGSLGPVRRRTVPAAGCWATVRDWVITRPPKVTSVPRSWAFAAAVAARRRTLRRAARLISRLYYTASLDNPRPAALKFVATVELMREVRRERLRAAELDQYRVAMINPRDNHCDGLGFLSRFIIEKPIPKKLRNKTLWIVSGAKETIFFSAKTGKLLYRRSRKRRAKKKRRPRSRSK